MRGGRVNQSATCHINDSVLTKENKGRFGERFPSLIEIKRHRESSLFFLLFLLLDTGVRDVMVGAAAILEL